MKSFYLLTILFAFSLGMNAQRWLQGAGSFGRDELNGLSISSSNAVFSTGIYGELSSFDAFQLEPIGNGDVFIAKQELNGAYSWVTRAGGLGIDRGNCIVAAPNNTIVVAGTYTQSAQFGSFQTTIQGSQDGFIGQLNESGTFNWLQTIGGTGWKNIRSITCDTQGNLFIAGEFSGEATFGQNTFTSAINPETFESSKDIFLAKLSNTGEFLWTKHGSADFDDQVFNIASDNFGNCYLTGRYSDTLSFIGNHPNTIYNAGFLMKVDGLGAEIWFKKLWGSQVNLQGLVCKNEEIVLGGSFSGNLSIQGSPNMLVSGVLPRNCFLAKLNSNGSIVWTSSFGSDNPISLNAIDVDPLGDIYAGGTFRCGLTGFRTPQTARLWETIGFRDIYVAKFSNSNGERLWAQHYAGQKEDVLNALKAIDVDDIIMGGFTRNGLSIPKPDNYILHSSNRPLSVTADPFQYMFYCQNETTGEFEYNENYFAHLATTPKGENDVFISRPVALNRELIDQFGHYGGYCDGNKPMPQPYIINSNYNPSVETTLEGYSLGADTISKCGGLQVQFPYHVLSYEGFRRDVSVHWSGLNDTPPATNPSDFVIPQTAWVYAELKFADGCASLYDSVYHIIDNLSPPLPVLTSSDITLYSFLPFSYQSSYYGFYIPEDTITLTASPQLPGDMGSWYSSYSAVDSTFLQNGYSISLPNPYDTITFVNKYDGGLCKKDRTAHLYPFLDYAADKQGNFLDSLNPGIFLIDSLTFTGFIKQVGDTIILCETNYGNKSLHVELADSTLWANQTEHFIFSRIRWTRIIPGFDTQTIGIGTYPFQTSVSTPIPLNAFLAGEFTLQAEILMPPNDVVYKTISRRFLVKKVLIPNNFTLDFPLIDLCPEDTLFALPTFADTIRVKGPDFDPVIWQPFQPIPITQPGYYSIQIINTSPLYGCTSLDIITEEIFLKSLYTIHSNPENGIICPGETVSISAEEGFDRYWLGPIGDTLGTEPSITVNTPGLYRYIQTDADGCRRSSEFIDIELKTIPYLQAEKNVICLGEELAIEVIADESSTIHWLPPLSGNQAFNVISGPGIYTAYTVSCGVNDTVSVPITLSMAEAEITAPNGLSFCPTTGIPLLANSGNYEFTWLPSLENGPIVNNLIEGTIILEAYNEFGCVARDTVNTIELNSLVPPEIAQSELVCNGDSVALFVNQNLNVAWLDFPNGNVIDSTNTLTLIAQENLTVYCKTKESAEGCESETIAYQVQLKPSLNLPDVLVDSVICAGTNLSLEVLEDSSVFAYQWSGPNNTSYTGSNWTITEVSSESSGVYQLQQIPTDNFCPISPFEIEIQVQPNPSPQIITSLDTLCEGSDVALSATVSSQSTIEWQNPAGLTVTTVELNLTNVGNTENGLYILTENLNGCLGTDSITLTVNPLPEIPLFTVEGKNCFADTITLQILNASTSENLIITTPNAAVVTPNAFSFPIEVSSNNIGTYSLILENNGCISPANYFELNPSLEVISEINTEYTFCINEANQINPLLSPIENVDSVTWILPNGSIELSSVLTLQENNFVPGAYILQVIDTNGCRIDFPFNVEFEACTYSGIPNSFTPNADGYNDSWMWTIPNAEDVSVSIFNRWGNQVIHFKSNPTSWNGTSNKGSLLPSAAYYYIIQYKLNNKKESISGFVEIKY